MENISNSTLNFGAAGKPGNFVRLGAPTNAMGQFTDLLGVCSKTPETNTATQSIILGPNVGGPGTSQTFSGIPIRVNVFTFISSGIGVGTISNGGDIYATID